MSIQVVSIGGVSVLQDLLSEDNVSFRYPAETWEDVIRHVVSSWSMLVLQILHIQRL